MLAHGMRHSGVCSDSIPCEKIISTERKKMLNRTSDLFSERMQLIY